MKTLMYNGQISIPTEAIYTDIDEPEDYYQGEFPIVRLSTLDEPLVRQIINDQYANGIVGRLINARYWISDVKLTKDQLVETVAKTAMGDSSVYWFASYSEVTPDLSHEETLKIGGHDLLEEFKASAGKWLYLELEYEK